MQKETRGIVAGWCCPSCERVAFRCIPNRLTKYVTSQCYCQKQCYGLGNVSCLTACRSPCLELMFIMANAKKAGVNKSEEIRTVAKQMKENGQKPRPVAIIAELEKRGITVSSPQVSIVLKKLGLRSSRGRKAGAGRKAAPTAKQPVVAASSSAAISIDDILAAKKAAAQLGGTDRALAALAALKRIES